MTLTPSPCSSDSNDEESSSLGGKGNSQGSVPSTATTATQINAKSPLRYPTKSSPVRSLYAEFVHVLVGPNKIDYGVHKGLLCKQSKYFDEMFNKSSVEASTGIVRLTKVSPLIFEIVQTWLYTGRTTRAVGDEDKEITSEHSLDLFLFGTEHDVPNLRNKAIDNLIELHGGSVPAYQDIIKAYQGTLEGSPIRKLFVDLIVYFPAEAQMIMHRHAEAFSKCPQFLIDVNVALLEVVQKEVVQMPGCVGTADPCEYHVHENGVGKCR